MTEERYQKILMKIRSHEDLADGIARTMRIITHGTVTAFIAMLVALLLNRQYREMYQALLVCGISFIVVSVVRKWIGAKRPYEIYAIEPLEPKESSGNSFPSRHVFSIFIIAMTFLKLNVILGIVFLILGVALAVLRVISGLHFPRDVISGAVIGVLTGLLGYWVIF